MFIYSNAEDSLLDVLSLFSLDLLKHKKLFNNILTFFSIERLF